jgi:quinol-cytochrome oxidoreductase complex cytochrome b subunit
LGGFAVDNATLNRFFSLHYLFPFLIFGVVVLHVWALHVSGSNNPTGIEPKTNKDTLPFHPYYTAKDTFGLLVFLCIYAAVTFYAPNMLGHPDNYIEANPMATPAHIVPEWYFLPFYAILRAITFGVNPYILVALGFIVAAMLPYYSNKKADEINCKQALRLFIAGGVFFMLGYLSQLETADGGTFISLPLDSMIFVNAKLGGVLAMFGSIAVLFVLPWLDTSPVRSARFRPLYKKSLYLFVFFFFVLGLVGANPAEGLWVITGQIGTAYYLGFFLIILPLLNKYEKTLPTPKSINEAVLAEEAG